MDVPGMKIGTLQIEGDYQQSADGVFKVDLANDAGVLRGDQLVVTAAGTRDGSVQLDGTLRVDASQLTSVQAGDKIRLVTAATGSGAFDSVQLVGDASLTEDRYFAVFYGGFAPAPGSAAIRSSNAVADEENYSTVDGKLLRKGDATDDGKVDDNDVRIFAAVLTGYHERETGFKISSEKTAVANFADAFDFVQSTTDVTGVSTIDVDDFRKFAERYRQDNPTMTPNAASARIQAIIEGHVATVPEPSTWTLILFGSLAGLAIRRARRMWGAP